MRKHLLACLIACAFGCGGKTSGTPADAEVDTASEPTDTMALDEGAPEDGTTPPSDAEVKPDASPPPVPTDKVDLLFVVDNSISMADKQGELARAIPQMIKDLTDPAPDATGTKKAVASLHVGVITSSLGSHGTSACAVEISNRANNDRGHLLPRSDEGGGTGYKIDATGITVSAPCPAPVEASPLRWTFGATSSGFSGADGAVQMGTAATCVVQSAKENGCGYEETLEAMYHFLIDPAPYAKAEVKCTFGISGDACGSNKIVVEGLDSELLAQRSAFLRPDSTVVVVVLSDENDFSLKPAGLNWLPWGYGKGQMQHGWASCATVPDDFEPDSIADLDKLHTTYKCFSCFEDGSDPNCKVPWAKDPLNNDVDGRNLRGFHQVQRYGYNFLWGRERYVAGLTQSMVVGSDNKLAGNPLFAGGRSAGNVIFAPIVGVPPSLVNGSSGIPKGTLTATEWDRIVGAPGVRDPHMIESIAPRPGILKYAGDRSVDPINGGDRDQWDGDDLQYACIAPRDTPGPGNECEGPTPSARSPLCSSTGTQTHYKAYPGLRHLRVARAVNGYPASICDAKLGNVLGGLVARLRPLIK